MPYPFVPLPEPVNHFEIVPGFFLHDAEHPIVPPNDPLPPHFGLLDTSPDRWEKFTRRVDELVKAAPDGVQYKVVVIGRHGEGWHNVADTKYGPQWDSYWGMKEGDGTLVWGPDAELSPVGIRQAETANALWKKELGEGMTLPTQLFTSPFARAIKTCQITFEDIAIANGKVRPTIIDMLRETMGVYPCDKRHPLSYILKQYPDFDLEPGATDEDVLWVDHTRETFEEQSFRQQAAFDVIFSGKNREHRYISVTCHSGTIRAILIMLSRQIFLIPTGGVLAFVIKATPLGAKTHHPLVHNHAGL